MSTFAELTGTLSGSSPLSAILTGGMSEAHMRSVIAQYLPTDTASGDIATFTDGAEDIPVEDLTVTIEPYQDTSSGDPSPDNVCSISGWTECTVYRSGTNMLPKAYSTQTVNGITYTVNDDGSITVSGTATSTSIFQNSWTSNTRFPLVAGTYYYSGCDTDVYCYMAYSPNDSSSNITTTSRITSGEGSFTLTSTVYAQFRLRVESGVTVDTVVYPMLSTSSGATWVEYEGDTYTVDLSSAGTVYGGTLDVTTGVLTVTHAIVDLGTLTWAYISANDVFGSGSLSSVILYGSAYAGTQIDGYCSAYQVGIYGANNAYSSSDNILWVHYSAGNLRLRATEYGTDASALTTALSGVQFVYPLATSTTYQLTPTEVRTLLGSNNIYADCGTVSVTYRADIGLYIDKVVNG